MYFHTGATKLSVRRGYFKGYGFGHLFWIEIYFAMFLFLPFLRFIPLLSPGYLECQVLDAMSLELYAFLCSL